MFRRRRALSTNAKRRQDDLTRDGIECLLNQRLARSQDGSSATAQGRKMICRKLLSDLGAVSTDEIFRNLKGIFRQLGIVTTRPYEVRHSVTTDINRCGLSHLALRYLTLHSIDDIMNEYTSIDVHAEMTKYFASVEPLLAAIELRAIELEILK